MNMKIRHSNIAIFIPHNGCKNTCSFCNQKTISGQSIQPSVSDIKNILSKAAADQKDNLQNTEIAFFGGSFTALEPDYMLMLLNTAFEYIKNYGFKGIRISTRPDAIDENILDILKQKGVTSVELGAQSMIDRVLSANNRGHSAQDIINASLLIKKHRFELGLQMMTGLYKSSPDDDYKTAQKLIFLSPDTMRIYPTTVLKGTALEELFKSGEYKPQTLELTVTLCAKILELCTKNNINVIKLGLHASDDIKNNMAAGVYHEAFRELVESEIFFNKALKLIAQSSSRTIQVAPQNLSKMAGHKKSNLHKFEELGINVKIIPNEGLSGHEVTLI